MHDMPPHECLELVDISEQAIAESSLDAGESQDWQADIDAYVRYILARLVT